MSDNLTCLITQDTMLSQELGYMASEAAVAVRKSFVGSV
jgi:hypothetical protein